MQDVSAGEVPVVEKTADQILIDDLMDKIDGLSSDLDDAVNVAVSRGAVEWARLNYPDHPALAHASPAMEVAAAAGVSALRAALSVHEMAVAAALKHLKGDQTPGTYDGMAEGDVIKIMVRSSNTAASLRAEIEAFLPDTLTSLNAKVLALAKNAAQAERRACLAAVARTAAPVTGTPYITGPRKFLMAISALPEPGHFAQGSIQELF